jgi:hypothetical protein
VLLREAGPAAPPLGRGRQVPVTVRPARQEALDKDHRRTGCGPVGDGADAARAASRGEGMPRTRGRRIPTPRRKTCSSSRR